MKLATASLPLSSISPDSHYQGARPEPKDQQQLNELRVPQSLA